MDAGKSAITTFDGFPGGAVQGKFQLKISDFPTIPPFGKFLDADPQRVAIIFSSGSSAIVISTSAAQAALGNGICALGQTTLALNLRDHGPVVQSEFYWGVNSINSNLSVWETILLPDKPPLGQGNNKTYFPANIYRDMQNALRRIFHGSK